MNVIARCLGLRCLIVFSLLSGVGRVMAQQLMVMELNCENIFDCKHDSLKNDTEYLPDGAMHWTPKKYWQKLDNIARVIVSPVNSSPNGAVAELPALVGLCEVENDSTMRDLTKRSMLRNAGYDYVMTSSADLRGIDVALLYQRSRFRLCGVNTFSVPKYKNLPPTRDILYAKGITNLLDTLHVFVVHAPSRRGGEAETRGYRVAVAHRLLSAIDSVMLSVPDSKVLVMGDFNDYCGDAALRYLCGENGVTGRKHTTCLQDVSCEARGIHNNVAGTYRYQGEWHSLDHILVSAALQPHVRRCYINDPDFLLTEEKRYGGKTPHRSFQGPRFDKDGYSDHLSLIIELTK